MEVGLLNFLIGAFIIVSTVAKGILYQKHLKSTQPGQLDQISQYMYSLPIFDRYSSSYKTTANSLIALQYIAIIVFLVVNWESLMEAWAIIKNMP